jgi:hypothetical protein
MEMVYQVSEYAHLVCQDQSADISPIPIGGGPGIVSGLRKHIKMRHTGGMRNGLELDLTIRKVISERKVPLPSSRGGF